MKTLTIVAMVLGMIGCEGPPILGGMPKAPPEAGYDDTESTSSALSAQWGPFNLYMGGFTCATGLRTHYTTANWYIWKTNEWDSVMGNYFWRAQIRTNFRWMQPVSYQLPAPVQPNLTIESDAHGFTLRDYNNGGFLNISDGIIWMHPYYGSVTVEYSHYRIVHPGDLWVGAPGCCGTTGRTAFGAVSITLGLDQWAKVSDNWGACPTPRMLGFYLGDYVDAPPPPPACMPGTCQ